MAEPTVSDKKEKADPKAQQAFLKAIETIKVSVSNALAKVAQAQAADCSTSIELQSHEVMGSGQEHTSIRITPKDAKYKNDPRFSKNADGHYVTIGAGFEYKADCDVQKGESLLDTRVVCEVKGGQELISDLNRPNDVGPHPHRVPLGPKDCQQESQVIERLLAVDANYKDDLGYDAFPERTAEEQAWYKPDADYNCNSYTAGLLDAAGLKKPEIDTETHPGWIKPVPAENFKERTLKPVIKPAAEALTRSTEPQTSSAPSTDKNQNVWDELNQCLPEEQNQNPAEEPNQSRMPAAEEVNQSVAPNRSALKV